MARHYYDPSFPPPVSAHCYLVISTLRFAADPLLVGHGDSGKPGLATPPGDMPLAFNLAHADDLELSAWCTVGPFGHA